MLSSMSQLSLLLGSAIFDSIYPLFLKIHHSGYIFVLAAASMAVSAIILRFVILFFSFERNFFVK